MSMALNLLANAQLGIAQIAWCVGYSDVSTFNHAFRRWTGCTPRDYRRSLGTTRARPSSSLALASRTARKRREGS